MDDELIADSVLKYSSFNIITSELCSRWIYSFLARVHLYNRSIFGYKSKSSLRSRKLVHTFPALKMQFLPSWNGFAEVMRSQKGNGVMASGS